jgi:hypothetical protein
MCCTTTACMRAAATLRFPKKQAQRYSWGDRLLDASVDSVAIGSSLKLTYLCGVLFEMLCVCQVPRHDGRPAKQVRQTLARQRRAKGAERDNRQGVAAATRRPCAPPPVSFVCTLLMPSALTTERLLSWPLLLVAVCFHGQACASMHRSEKAKCRWSARCFVVWSASVCASYVEQGTRHQQLVCAASQPRLWQRCSLSRSGDALVVAWPPTHVL